jgi:hypothetical protein
MHVNQLIKSETEEQNQGIYYCNSYRNWSTIQHESACMLFVLDKIVVQLFFLREKMDQNTILDKILFLVIGIESQFGNTRDACQLSKIVCMQFFFFLIKKRKGNSGK